MKKIPRLLIWVYLAVLALDGPLAARAENSPEFFLETITVQGAERFGPSIVRAESLLDEGESYSEAELRDAARRIARLPLILEAQFSLRKGSARGRYELVIAVEEARRWFFGAELASEAGDDRIRPFRGEEGAEGFRREFDDDDETFFAGFRVAAGRQGVLSLALEPSGSSSDTGDQYGRLQLGYTQYDLFDHSIQLNLQYRYEPLAQSGSLDQEIHTLWFGLGVPLWGNHSLSLESTYRRADRDTNLGPPQGSLKSESEALRLDLSWITNSLDDPVFPREGSFLRTGFSSSTEDVDQRRDFGDTLALGIRQEAKITDDRLYLSLDRYWAWHDKDSVSVSLDLTAGRSEYESDFVGFEGFVNRFEVDTWDAQLALGYDRFLHRDTKKPRWRELRWENAIEIFDGDFDSPPEVPEVPSRGLTLRTGLKYRTSWGVFGVSLGYTLVEDGR